MHEGEIRGIGKVAIKVMFCRNDTELNKKKIEADLHAGLNHPNICFYYTSFLDENF